MSPGPADALDVLDNLDDPDDDASVTSPSRSARNARMRSSASPDHRHRPLVTHDWMRVVWIRLKEAHPPSTRWVRSYSYSPPCAAVRTRPAHGRGRREVGSPPDIHRRSCRPEPRLSGARQRDRAGVRGCPRHAFSAGIIGWVQTGRSRAAVAGRIAGYGAGDVERDIGRISDAVAGRLSGRRSDARRCRSRWGGRATSRWWGCRVGWRCCSGAPVAARRAGRAKPSRRIVPMTSRHARSGVVAQ
jgi:hypothetical protein